MAGARRERGRPKGTGKNDEPHLRAIAALLRADPDLKPTTAIKQLGHSDPSTIRRLRDKFKARRQALMTSRAPLKVDAGATTRSRPVLAYSAERAAQPLIVASGDVKRSKTSDTNCQEMAAEQEPGSAGTTVAGQDGSSAGMYRLATECVLMMAEQQLVLARELAGNPSVKFVLEQQVRLSNVFLQLCSLPNGSKPKQ